MRVLSLGFSLLERQDVQQSWKCQSLSEPTRCTGLEQINRTKLIIDFNHFKNGVTSNRLFLGRIDWGTEEEECSKCVVVLTSQTQRSTALINTLSGRPPEDADTFSSSRHICTACLITLYNRQHVLPVPVLSSQCGGVITGFH